MPGAKGCAATSNNSGQVYASSYALIAGSNGLFCVLLLLSFPPSIKNNMVGKPVIFLTMGWAGSELRKEWWLFDSTHTIDLTYCKSRTGQNISPLEQEKNQETTRYVALLSDFVVIPELSPYCIFKLIVKIQAASILSHTTGRVYLKQLSHSL